MGNQTTAIRVGGSSGSSRHSRKNPPSATSSQELRPIAPAAKGLVFLAERVVWAARVGTMWQVLKEFLVFLRQEKKWWLLPLVVLLLAIGAVIVFTSSSILAPFLYPFL